jgi:hypothetical protein
MTTTPALARLQDPRLSGRARRRPRIARGPPREDVSEMGEAKRRQSATTRTTQYYDIVANEIRPAKAGGDPEVLIGHVARREFPPVPCIGCVECCYHTRVEVDPDLEQPEDLACLARFAKSSGGPLRLFRLERTLDQGSLTVRRRRVGPFPLRQTRAAVAQANTHSAHRRLTATLAGRDRGPHALLGGVRVQADEFSRRDQASRSFLRAAIIAHARRGLAPPARSPIGPGKLRL